MAALKTPEQKLAMMFRFLHQYLYKKYHDAKLDDQKYIYHKV